MKNAKMKKYADGDEVGSQPTNTTSNQDISDADISAPTNDSTEQEDDDQTAQEVASADNDQNDQADIAGETQTGDVPAANQPVPASAAEPTVAGRNITTQPQVSQAKDNSQIQSAPTPKPAVVPPVTAQQRDTDDAKFAHDVMSGAIKPETYQDLFAKKSTLGKIGTLFGLALGGAGAGLAHQPNALLGMMNSEIERDLEAQKQNVASKQNFLNSTYQHEINQSEIQRNNYQNQLAQTQMGEAKARTVGLNQENLKNAAYNKVAIAMLGNLNQATQNNPVGQQLLQNTVVPAVMQKVSLNNQQNAARDQLTYNQLANGQQQPDLGVNQALLNQKMDYGRMFPNLPGVIPSGEVPEVQAEAARVENNRNLTNVWKDSFNSLNSDLLADKFNPQKRAALVDSIGARIAKDSGVFSVDQAKGIADGMLPNFKDFGGARQEKFRKGMEHFQTMEGNTPFLDRYGLKTSFPQYTFGAAKTNPYEGKTATGPQGQVVMKNGKWIPISNVASGGR